MPQQNAPSSDNTGNQPVLSAAPRMIGDFPGYYGTSMVTVNSTYSQFIPIITQIPNPNGEGFIDVTTIQQRDIGTISETFKFATLALSRGAFKIAENESVQPQDRFYISYNNFHLATVQGTSASGIFTPIVVANPAAAALTQGSVPLRSTLQQTLANQGGQPTTLTDVNVQPYDIHRETVGFEKTFLNGNASLGIRVPVFQTTQDAGTATVNSGRLAGFSSVNSALNVTGYNPGFDGSRVGDISTIFKYALINEPDARGIVTGGLVVTAPTGGGIPLANGDRLYSTLLQPYTGYFKIWDRAFVHGFSAIAVPTDNNDVTLLFNDIGCGYFLYRNPDAGFLTSIAPNVEVHASTPISNGNGGIYAPDLVAITGGVSVGIGQRAVLTFGCATPVTGPRPYQLESAVQFNWMY